MKNRIYKILIFIIAAVIMIAAITGKWLNKRTHGNLSAKNKIEYRNHDNPEANKIHRFNGTVINDFNGVARYIHEHGKLPDNYITKEKARDWGWEPGDDLSKTCPEYSIGGDVFTNSEGYVPSKDGRIWRECDINYVSGHRNALRILYSSDGLIYKTEDHYSSFTKMY